MPLRVNNTEITQVYFNGVEQKVLKYNGTGYFGKSYTLTQSTSSNVVLSVNRTSSPNQGAATGKLSAGEKVYYGDAIIISVSAVTNYRNAKLYVDIGDGTGLVQRTSSYSFTVAGNVTFSGSAEPAEEFQQLWSGSSTYTASGSFNVSGLANCSEVQVTASAVFQDIYFYTETEEVYAGNTYDDGRTRGSLPVTLMGCNASIQITRNDNQLQFLFDPGYEESKGYILYEMPKTLTITEVRGR